MTNRSPVYALVVLLEVFLLFVVGIAGSKVAERLNVSPTVLLIATIASLSTLAAVSYAKSQFHQTIPVQGAQTELPHFKWVRRFVPRTAISIFPFGMISGLVIGTVLHAIGVSGSRYHPPQWLCGIVNMCQYSLAADEFAAVVIGVLILVIFALLMDGVLAGALSLGYGLALPVAVLTAGGPHDISATYTGHILFFGVLAILLVISEPLMRPVRRGVFQPRL